RDRGLIAGTSLQAVGLCVVGAIPSLAAACAGGSLWAMGLSLRTVSVYSTVQQRTPDALLGRTTAAMWMVGFLGGAASAPLLTRAASAMGASRLLVTDGILIGCVVIVAAI